jgi:lysophospholipase L1-like esterase
MNKSSEEFKAPTGVAHPLSGLQPEFPATAAPSAPPFPYPYAPYNQKKMDPQLAGWPLSEAEKKYVLQEEFAFRKPGCEQGKRFPNFDAVTPSAGYWPTFFGNTEPGDTQWLDIHGRLVEKIRATRETVDVVLLGDSIVQGFGGGWNGPDFNPAWKRLFANYSALNLGISGDKVENILWRIDHGAVDGLCARVIVLLVGINNHPGPDNAAPIAEGIGLCIRNLRLRLPGSHVIVVKTPPARNEDVRPLHQLLETIPSTQDPMVHLVDVYDDLVNRDGSLKALGFADDKLHLDIIGYEILATRLKPVLRRILNKCGNDSPEPPSGLTLTLVHEHPKALLKAGLPGMGDNLYGVEGGCVVKIRDTYHFFTAEMSGDPRLIKMRLAHWCSEDRLCWTRRQTIVESSAAPGDPRASLWAPMPVYDDREGLWNLFYVAYTYVNNYTEDGRIWRAVSKTPGPDGINGPWRDVGVVLQMGKESQNWEGLQGVDSFFPYPVVDKWLGFYGSSDCRSWFRVGLAESPALSGPWKRRDGNPITLSGPRGSENPVVTRLKSGRYVAVFETVFREDGFGYADSADGIHWSEARELPLLAPLDALRKVRTPLGLIEEDDGTFSVFYTGFARGDDWGELWYCRVRIEECNLGSPHAEPDCRARR